MSRPKGITLCHPGRPHSSKGLCKYCYAETRRRRLGIKPRRHALPLDEKLATRTDRSAGPDGCWPWIGTIGNWGHPTVNHDNKTLSVRRVVWEKMTRSPPAKNRWVTTTCDLLKCVNPRHLALRAHHDVLAKFWEKVKKADGDACWLWQGHKYRGYGRYHAEDDKHVFAHRFMYELHHEVKLDPSVCVCHRCDNPTCVNPAHLWLGTHADNTADKVAKGRQSRGEMLSKAVRAGHERRRARVAACASLSNGLPQGDK